MKDSISVLTLVETPDTSTAVNNASMVCSPSGCRDKKPCLSADDPHQHGKAENDERQAENAGGSDEHVGLNAIEKSGTDHGCPRHGYRLLMGKSWLPISTACSGVIKPLLTQVQRPTPISL